MKKDVVIQMDSTMEATPIAHLVQLANQFDSRVYLEMDTKRVNAKSIMGMMSLVLSTGNTVTIDAEGDDEDKAIVAMEKFLTN
jgi:catabolite repression HPr-like protein